MTGSHLSSRLLYIGIRRVVGEEADAVAGKTGSRTSNNRIAEIVAKRVMDLYDA